MAEQRVTTSTRLWSTEVALAESMDAIYDGEEGVAALTARAPYPDAYVFSNGRKFADKRNPYE